MKVVPVQILGVLLKVLKVFLIPAEVLKVLLFPATETHICFCSLGMIRSITLT